MTRQDIINDICRIVREHHNSEISMYNLGVEWNNHPIVAVYGRIKIVVSTLKSNGNVYLSVWGNRGNRDLGVDWVTYDDIPTQTLKEIYSILKTSIKKK